MNVYRDLRARILFGDYAPGQSLTLQGLAQDIAAGMTPIREAVRRLTAEGAVRMRGNRRLEVPVLTRGDIDELSFLRSELEPELTRRATPRLSAGQISTLRQLDRQLDAAIKAGDIPGYLHLNHAFHHGLYAAAEAPILLETAERLWLRFGPSLRVVCGRFGTLNLPDQHAEILTALELGDASAAAHAMREDVLQGMQQIASSTDSIDAE
jgi:DNA-binding GntR family transcriptional regulator